MKQFLLCVTLSVPLWVLPGMMRASPAPAAASAEASGYLLGPDDMISVRVKDVEEFSPSNLTPVRIDPGGDIRLPLVGRIHAAGLSVEQCEARIREGLFTVMKNPDVTVTVTEFGSRPVSVLGAVRNPGVHQISGNKTLFEVLSLAGGLNQDAGNTVEITRRAAAGPLPLAGATPDRTGQYLKARLDIHDLMEAKNPAVNISILPDDVITVPKADMVYVVGAVKRAGGFPLNEKEQISVLQALSLAEGLDAVAAAGSARILRQESPETARVEIPIDLGRVLDGSKRDIPLQANDILFIPNSKVKSAGLRALDTAIQLGTGMVIYRR